MMSHNLYNSQHIHHGKSLDKYPNSLCCMTLYNAGNSLHYM